MDGKRAAAWIGVCSAAVILLFALPILAEDDTEMLKIGVAGISKAMFNPKNGAETVISGEILYLTKSGSFDEPEVNALINGVNVELPVSLTPLPLPGLPEEHKDHGRHWSFSVRWDGKDKENFFVDPGRYECLITVRVLKTDTVTEIEDGKEVEKTVETLSDASASAPILIVNN